MLPWNFVIQTKEGNLHKSATISQWERPCDKWSRTEFVGLQHLATNSTSANFNKNINRISKLSKCSRTTMPTFDEKSDIIDLSENLFDQVWKTTVNSLKKTNKTGFTLSCVVMRHKLWKISQGSTERIWKNFWLCSVEKYVKHQSRPTAKRKFQRLIFSLANQNLFEFLNEL